MLTRRHLLASASALPFIGLAGCATPTTTTSSIPIWISALEAIATEAGSILPQLTAVGLSGSALSTAQSIIAEIKAVCSAINNASTVAQGQSTLQQVETYINTLAPLVLPFVSLVPGGSIIGLIVAALPSIEAALNFIVSALTPQAQQIAASAPTPPASARYGAASESSWALNLLIQKAQKAQMRRYQRRRR